MAGAGALSHNPSLASQVAGGWTKLGENVGEGGGITAIFNALVNSPPHLANMLDPSYNLTGIGVAVGNGGSLWITEDFEGRPGVSSPPPAPVPAPMPSWPVATGFRPDGVLASSPATVNLANVGPMAFVLGTDGGLWYSTQSVGWRGLGTPPGLAILGDPSAVSWGPGRVDVFVQGSDHKLWQRFSTCGGCSWSSWMQPVGNDGMLGSSPAVTSWGPGRIDIIVQGTDGNLYQRDWEGSGWSGAWSNLGSPPAGVVGGEHPTVTSWGAGRLDVFTRGRDSKLWQTFMVNGAWQGWTNPPGTANGTLNAAPAASAWSPNRLTVFVQGTDRHLYQTTYNGGWGGWAGAGGPGDMFQGAPEAPSTLQAVPYVLVRGTDNMAYAFFPR
jgi:hypothetical protein